MYLFSTFTTALRSIAANKVRAILTTLGIIIGISAVIAMISIGQGAQSQILSQVQGLGSNTITIFPVGNFSGPSGRSDVISLINNRLDSDLLRVLSNEITFREITGISPQLSGTFEVIFRSRSDSYEITGINNEYEFVSDLTVTNGRFIRQDDEQKLKKVAVLGADVVSELFGENDPLNKEIRIDGSLYRVVGILEEQSQELDSRIYIPITTATNVLIGDRNYSQITVKVGDEDLIDSVATKIEDELMDYYRIIDPEDANFTVITSKEILSLVGTITSVFTTLLASIASISLVVGGIGIMNIMLVSVSERTREIGLRKAVGAKQAAILGQFLMEAVVLTVIGGLIGIALGIGGALIAGELTGIPVEFTIESVVLATSVSAAIGITFGFYPAYRASQLNPIDALRYE